MTENEGQRLLSTTGTTAPESGAARVALPGQRPRIAVISQQFGTVGGLELFAREVTERLARSGRYEMHVFSRKWESTCEEITFHRVPMWGVPRQLVPTMFSWLACRMARKMGFDLLHAHSRCSDADIYSVHWVPHGFWAREILRRKPRWSDRLRMRIDARMIERGRDRVFMPVSSLQREIFEQEFGSLPGTWTVIAPGVDVERFGPERLAPLREPTRQALGIRPEERVVLFVGMNWESKGLETLIRALGRARSLPDGSCLRLLVVGKGDESRFRRVAQEERCAEAVLFAGAHRTGIERFFAAADLFAMPAEFETFSMVTLEAMVAGLPVIVSDRMGVRDLVGEAGTVLPDPIDLAALVHALRTESDPTRTNESRLARAVQFANERWERPTGLIAVQYAEFLRLREESRGGS